MIRWTTLSAFLVLFNQPEASDGVLGIRLDALTVVVGEPVSLGKPPSCWPEGYHVRDATPKEIARAEVCRTQVILEAVTKWDIDPHLARSISHAENWRADNHAVSTAGAIGLMQVMPFWANELLARPCASKHELLDAYYEIDLTNPRENVCVGVRVLAMYLRRCVGDVPCALKRYNGARTWERARYYIQTVMGRYDHYRGGGL